MYLDALAYVSKRSSSETIYSWIVWDEKFKSCVYINEVCVRRRKFS